MKKLYYYFSWNNSNGIPLRSLPKFGRKMFILTAALLFSISLHATNYYISSSQGSDSNAGTSESQPWKTLAKVNSFTPSPGDQILFKRGDSWTGTITVNASGTSGSPIVYGAYGTGEKPKIYGSEEITGWTQQSGNIYKASFSSNVEQLFLDSKRMKLARFPNSGYIKISSIATSTKFTSNDLNDNINYTGSTWIGRTTAFNMYSKSVIASSSKTLTLSDAPYGSLGVGEGFFLCDKLEFLDSPGEWYYDNSSNTVYLWTNTGSSPNNYQIAGSTFDYGIKISNYNFITIENIEVLHSAVNGILIDNSDNVTIDNTNIISSDLTGINFPLANATNATLTNNYIYQSNGNGIRCFSPNATIANNVIEDTGLLDNFNKNTLKKDNTGTGIFSRSNNPTIEYNRVINSGYAGINWKGTNGSIKYNYVDGACLVIDDAGGIYSYNGSDYNAPASAGSVVSYNIIKNVLGNADGYTKGYHVAAGIYLDNAVHDVILEYNTISTVTCGIYFHDNGANTFKNNLVVDATIMIHNDGEYANCNINNNIFYCGNRIGNYKWWPSGTHQRIVYQENGASFLFDKNKYYTPYKTDDVFIRRDGFADWQSSTGQDVNSSYNDTQMAEGETEVLFYNATNQTKTINLGTGVYKDIDRNNISGTITLQPFTSKLFIKTKSGSSNQKPTIENQTFEIQGNKEQNEYIGKVIASDPDQNQELNYSIVQGNESDLFSINSSTGEILANKILQFQTNTSIELVVSVTDNAVDPLSASAVITINVVATDSEGNLLPDTTPPTIISYSIPTTYTSLTIPITSFVATDDRAVTGYLLTESSNAPLATNNNWESSPPESYTFAQEGTKTLYAWAKDAAGNISVQLKSSVMISLLDLSSTYSEYKFEESPGATVLDNQGSNHGHIFNEELRVNGINGQGLQFTGAGYISLGESFGTNVTDEITLSAWIKPSLNTQDGTYQGIIMHGGPNIDSYALYIRPIYNSIGFKTSGTSSSWSNINNIDILWDGNWHHLAVTYDGNQKIIYLDGIPISKVIATGTLDSGAGYNLLIGAGRDDASPSQLFQGSIDEVRIYNYALTGSEISALNNFDNDGSDPQTPTNPDDSTGKDTKIETSEDISICEGDSYQGWTSTGQYQRTLTTSSGQDSIITTNLTVNPVYNVTENITIVEGDSYLGWTEAGEYERILTASFGCDSIVTTLLSVEIQTPDSQPGSIQSIELKRGWNIFSSRLIPPDVNMETVTQSLRDENLLVEVQDELGNDYDLKGKKSNVSNNIGNLAETEGYRIRVKSDCVLEIEGQSIVLPLNIEVNEGWNIISFPYNGTIDAMTIIQPLIDAGILEKIQDEEGNSIEYWDSSIGWVNNIGNFQPGEGYQVQVISNGVLPINEVYPKSALQSTEKIKTSYFKPKFEGNGSDHMNINIYGLNESNLKVGDEIAAFDDEICVGAIKLTDAHFLTNTVSINASVTDDILVNGFIEGNSIELKAWSDSSGAETNIEPVVTRGDMYYQKQSSVFVQLSGQVTTDITDLETINIDMYPNPAREKVTVRFAELPETEANIIISDITGKQLLNRVVVSNMEVLDINFLTDGIYLVKTIIGNKYQVNKLIKN